MITAHDRAVNIRSAALVLVALMATACGDGSTGTGTPEPTSVPEEHGEVWSRVDLPGLDDNVKHDTLLIQTTFDLGDSTYLMVASHVEETREGIRLYRYRVKPDSSAEVLSWSKPGYDSSTMLPTFFRSPDASQGWLLLANMGERESWGQEVFWLKDGAFIHMGYLDVAQREWKTYDDSTYQWRTNIAPRALVERTADAFLIGFSGDSIQLYDDLQGNRERMLRAQRLRYRCAPGQATLLIDGKPVLPAVAG